MNFLHLFPKVTLRLSGGNAKLLKETVASVEGGRSSATVNTRLAHEIAKIGCRDVLAAAFGILLAECTTERCLCDTLGHESTQGLAHLVAGHVDRDSGFA